MIRIQKTNNISKIIDIVRPCRVYRTSNGVIIKSKLGDMIFSSNGVQLNGKELAFVRKFRNYYVQNGETLVYNKKFKDYNAVFFKFFVFKGKHEDVVEIDINRAYPTAGRILNIVPDDLYEESIKLNKQAALIAIGSLYRRRKVIDVDTDGKRKVVENENRIPYLSDLWRSIVGYTDYCVNKTANKIRGKIYFYWCDALFVKKSAADLVIKTLSDYGFSAKTIEIQSLEFAGDRYISTRKDGVVKEYTLPRKTYYVDSVDEFLSKSKK